MKTTMDSVGRLVIPSAVRREAGIKPGMPLEIRWSDGRIEIEPAPMPVRLERRGRLLVANSLVPIEPLSNDVVEKTRAQLQIERESAN